jgi:acetyl esterase/lipase
MLRSGFIVLPLLILILLSVGNAQRPQQPSQLEDPPWLKEFVSKRIVYSVPGMERVRVLRDQTYGRVNGEDLKADFYSPIRSGRAARRPAVIFIHGGRVPPNLRTKPKDWAVYVSFGQLVAASGYIGVTFNHRFYTWDSLNDSLNDVDKLIAYVRNNAEALGVDKDRLTLWSVSAGSIFLSQTIRDTPSYIRSLVLYYPVLDLQSERKQAPSSVTNETLREHSPLHQLTAKGTSLPPLFIARAGLDDANLNAGIDRFVQIALAKNLNVDLTNHSQGHHGFDIEDDNARSREIIKRTLDFIREHG